MATPAPAIVRSFASGEMSPTLHVRADMPQYKNGCRTCRNMVVEKTGAVANRAGTRYVAALKTAANAVRLVPYTSETPGSSVVIEMGASYLRFFKLGARIEVTHASVTAWSNATNYVQGDLAKNGGVVYYCILAHINQAPPNATYWYALSDSAAGIAIYEIPTPFTLPLETNWVQSGRVITFTHQAQRPHDLAFVSLTRWVLVPLVTTPDVGTPTGLALATVGGAENFAYKITAVAPGTFEESDATAEVRDSSSLAPSTAAPHLLTWTAVTVGGVACPEYHIYLDLSANGTFGYIGTATGQVNFQNPGITPDYAITPPASRDLFNASSDRPAACAYHKQRRYFANTVNNPDAFHASRVGFPDNFGISSPLQDDDSISGKLFGNNNHAIRFMVALKKLLLLTDGGEWPLEGAGGEAITPNNLESDQETYNGIAINVRPVVIGNSVLYAQARQTVIRELRFDRQVEGLAGRDLSIFANHLFDGYTIVAMAYQQIPDSILWCVRSDGVLLGLTYIFEQDVLAWHRHDTTLTAVAFNDAGLFLDVCVVPEPDRDAVYLTTTRTRPGPTTFHSLEVLASRQIRDTNTVSGALGDVFFVDAGLSYSGAAATVFSGLGHLEGCSVAASNGLQDLGDFTVASGAITVPVAQTTLHAGIRIRAELEPLDLDVDGSQVRDAKKRAHGLALLLHRSSRVFKHSTDNASYQAFALEVTADATNRVEYTGRAEFTPRGNFNPYGRYQIRQDAALPIRILGAIPLFEVGG